MPDAATSPIHSPATSVDNIHYQSRPSGEEEESSLRSFFCPRSTPLSYQKGYPLSCNLRSPDETTSNESQPIENRKIAVVRPYRLSDEQKALTQNDHKNNKEIISEYRNSQHHRLRATAIQTNSTNDTPKAEAQKLPAPFHARQHAMDLTHWPQSRNPTEPFRSGTFIDPYGNLITWV